MPLRRRDAAVVDQQHGRACARPDDLGNVSHDLLVRNAVCIEPQHPASLVRMQRLVRRVCPQRSIESHVTRGIDFHARPPVGDLLGRIPLLRHLGESLLGNNR
eukprot:Amastigsp_a1451_35.p7 type:complete len:103 gc:universal Amastigsp_a1451_35:986-1294(+)